MDNSALKRVITLIDMDCFYCQVELRLNPELAGKPVAVVQYNQWKQGGIIAVNYEARDRGVTRFMRGEEAKEVCPELCLASVPSVRGKADLTRYREAGVEVANVFSSFSDCVLRASVDEAFIDLTSLVEDRIKSGNVELSTDKLPSTFVVGHTNLKGNDMEDRKKGCTEWVNSLKQNAHLYNPDYRLFVGALIVEEIRSEVLKRTGFHCSGGIGHNKILAKLVAGLHKPKCQTVIPHENVPELYETLPLKKVRNLGGKFGKQVAETLSISYMSELYNYSKEKLIEKFNVKNGTWLYEIARGIDHELVTSRLIPESIGCSKNFLGPVAIKTKEKLISWLSDMSQEVVERLEKDLAENARRAKLLTVSFRHGRNAGSRSCPLVAYKVENIAKDAYEILLKLSQAPLNSSIIDPSINNLGLSASKFVSEKNKIKNFLKEMKTSSSTSSKSSPSTSKGDALVNEDCSDGIKTSNNILFKNSTADSETPTTDVIDLTDQKTQRKTIASFFQTKTKEMAVTSAPVESQNRATVSEQAIDEATEFSDLAHVTKDKTVEKPPDKPPINSFFAKMLEQQVVASTSCMVETQAKVIVSEIDELINQALEGTECSNDSVGTGDQTKENTKDKLPINSFFAKMLAEKVTTTTKGDIQDTPKNEPDAVKPEAIQTAASTSSASDDDWTQVCPDCNEKIHLSVYVEHLDYHAALNLDKALNGKPMVPKFIAKPTKKPKGSPVRKKRKILKPVDQTEITSFFTSVPKS